MSDDIRPIPQQLLGELRMQAHRSDDQAVSEQRWAYTRLVERAYSMGYHDGYVRCMSEPPDPEPGTTPNTPNTPNQGG